MADYLSSFMDFVSEDIQFMTRDFEEELQKEGKQVLSYVPMPRRSSNSSNKSFTIASRNFVSLVISSFLTRLTGMAPIVFVSRF